MGKRGYRKHTILNRVLLIVPVASFLLLAAVFPAEALAPKTCSTSSWTTIPFHFDQWYWKRDLYDRSEGYQSYQSKIHWYWPILMSAHINQMRFHYDENWNSNVNSNDYFYYQDNAGWHAYNGALSGYTPAFTPIRNANKSYSRITAEFDSSDDNSNALGVFHNGVEVKCDNTGTSANSINLENTHELDVILLGTGDTVYFNVTQPANIHMSVTMNAVAKSAYSDFDIFASTTNTMPDSTTAQWMGYSSQPSEAIWIPSYASQRTVYFTINSWSGQGHVRVHVTPVMSSVPTMKVCTRSGWNATGPERTTISDRMKESVQGWYGMTDSENRILQLNLYLDGTESSCDVYLLDAGGRSSTTSFSTIKKTGWEDGLYWWGWDAQWEFATAVIVHELAHLKGYQTDESPDATGAYCGHTLMASPYFTRDLCGNEYHGYDGQWNNPNKGASGWSRFCSNYSIWIQRTGTADPSDFYHMDNFDVITPVVIVR